jgi:TrmH family RNA methyltransferase
MLCKNKGRRGAAGRRSNESRRMAGHSRRTRFVSAKLDNLRVVLVGTRNPLNIGAAARAMSNFGVQHLRVVNAYEVAFREARSAVDATELLSNAEEFGSVAEAVADCRLVVGTTAAGRRELRHRLLRLEAGGRVIRRRVAAGPVALLFGSEKVGLSNTDLSYCDWLLRVPTRAQHGSMNLGQAVAVCLYELVRDGKMTQDKNRAPSAEAAKLEMITRLLLGVLRASGYVKPRLDGITEENVRRMVRRMQLNASDAEVWLGMLRQIAWKVRTEDADG